MTMHGNGFAIQMLDDDGCTAIVDAAYTVLGEFGCRVVHPEAQELLETAGAKRDGDIFRISRALIEECIERNPKEVALFTRDGDQAFVVNGESAAFGPFLGSPNTVDLETGEARPFTHSDATAMARLCHALPNIDFAASNGQICDIDASVAQLYDAREMICNTTKPFVTWVFDPAMFDDVLAMCEAACGGPEAFAAKPFMFMGVSPDGNLMHSGTIELLLHIAAKRVPVSYTPAPVMGIQVPVTVAGSLVAGLCDTLVGLVLVQLKSPGAPFMAADLVMGSDMRLGTISHSNPEELLALMGAADVFRYLGIPCMSTSGPSDANSFDAQAAADNAIALFSALASRAGLCIFAGGAIGGTMVNSFEGLVFADEVISELKVLQGGIALDEESLALEAIGAVGPNGVYLGCDHTVDFMGELWKPRVYVRESYDKWQKSGAKTLEQRLNEVAKAILAKGNQAPLPDDVVAKIDRIIGRAMARIARQS